jgi:signal transduction histidine kinase
VLDDTVEPSDVTWTLIHDEVGRLKRLVVDLQELSRAEARQLVLHPTLTEPTALVAQAVGRLEPQFREKGVALSADVAPALPRIAVDSDRMLQVLVNLLGNALRATPSGGQVRVSARLADRALLVEVADTGIGIAVEHLPHLFERFYRVDKSRSRALGGHGIGLTISKALVEAHGGEIWATSDGPGSGATFHVRLPLAIP